MRRIMFLCRYSNAETYLRQKVYRRCPRLVARCPLCGRVLLRFANVQVRVFLHLRRMAYLTVDTAPEQERIRERICESRCFLMNRPGTNR